MNHPMRNLIKLCEDATHSLLTVDESVVEASMPVPYLYHATNEANLAAIKREGILTRFYGVVHGGMDMHPPKPAIYLSRNPKSNNLNTDLFKRGPVIVLKIDAKGLDQEEIYPDDFFYKLVAEGEVFSTAKSITKALDCPLNQAKAILTQIENADDHSLPLILKPFWRWYLGWRKGGEIAYTADIAPNMILDVQPF